MRIGELSPAQYLLISQGVHIPNNLCSHFPGVCGTILKGSLNNGHDEGQRWCINEMDKFGIQQGLQALLGLSGWISECIQENRGNCYIFRKGVEKCFVCNTRSALATDGILTPTQNPKG